MSSGRDEDSDRFADAWDRQGRDTGRSEAASLRPDPRSDADLSDDVDLAALLREAGRSTAGPDSDASARMRAGLMAAIGDAADTASASPARRSERPLTESRRSASTGSRGPTRSSDSGRDARPGDSRPRDGRPGTRAGDRRTSRRGASRILASGIAGFCAVLVLGALTVLISRGSLPGEMLYGVKRASESAEMGLTSGQEAQGRKHLEFAALRLDEVGGLISRDSATAAGSGPVAAGLDEAEAALVTQNLRSFDEQARSGARLMLPLAQQPTGPSPAELAEWARRQQAVLGTMNPSLTQDGQTALAGSRELLDRMSARASALEDRRTCAGGTSGVDELGPLPSSATCPGSGVATSAPTVGSEPTSTSTTTTTTTTTTTSSSSSTTTSEDTSSQDSSSGAGAGAGPGSDTGSNAGAGSGAGTGSSSTPSSRTTTPPPVSVPVPVPGLPKVELPPLLPGLPGISLG